MNPDCPDYYIEEVDSGCCLRCSESEIDCLCYDCKCSKCFWYDSPEEYNFEKGHCGMVDVLKKRKMIIISKKFPCTIYSKVGLNPNQSQLGEFEDETNKT